MREGPFEKSFLRRRPGKTTRPGKDAARAHRRQPLQACPGTAPGPESRTRPAHPPQPRAGRLPGTAPNPGRPPRHTGCTPKGGSDPYSRPLSDRGPVSREFSRNSGVGVIEKPPYA